MLFNVVEMELSSLVTEQKLVTTWVQLKVVYLVVMSYGGLDLIESEVLNADSHAIKQIGNDLGGVASS